MSGSIYNILSNDNIKPNGIDQRYSGDNQHFSVAVISNICEDESDEENDDNEEMVPMDVTEVIDPMRIYMDHTVEPTLHSSSNLSSEPLNFPICDHRSMSSNTTYQPKCASSTASSAERYRQWQILGGGFGENYDILPPEEEEFDEESEKESEEAKDFESDLSSFLEQIISVHVQKQLNQDESNVATPNLLKCNCLRSDCRIKQYLAKNEMSNPSTIQEVNQTPPSNNFLFRSSELSENSISSNNLSDNISSNSKSAASSKMLNLVLKQKNCLNITPETPSEPESQVHTKSEHHTTYVGRSVQVISQCQKQYNNHNNKTTRHKPEPEGYVSSCPMPDLPKECSLELRKSHDDMLRRAGGINRVKRLYDELAFLATCLQGWRILLETSPKEGNTLLMWLCCQPHKTQQTNSGRKIRGITLDINRFLYSKITAVVMAMIWEAYGNDTKDIRNKCLLFERNSQEASSLELASLTNKSVVASWLALLYPCFGLDVNKPNQLGHTVLHFLAKKGDEAADTLQELLRLKNPSSCSSSVPFGRLFRLDIVNGGAKTPYDVAVACDVNARKDGTSDTQYKKVISCFHDSIVEEAEEFEKNLNLSS